MFKHLFRKLKHKNKQKNNLRNNNNLNKQVFKDTVNFEEESLKQTVEEEERFTLDFGGIQLNDDFNLFEENNNQNLTLGQMIYTPSRENYFKIDENKFNKSNIEVSDELSKENKYKCLQLKQIRKKVATDLGCPELVNSEPCTSKEKCTGTCPACQAEEKALTAKLIEKRII